MSKQFLKFSFYMVTANVLGSVTGLCRTIYIAKNIDPSDYATFNLTMSMLIFANFFDLGLNTALLYELPRTVGSNQHDRARQLQEQGATGTLLLVLIGVVLAIAVSFGLEDGVYPMRQVAFLAVVAIPIYQASNFMNAYARATESFTVVAVVSGVVSVLNLAASVVVVRYLSAPYASSLVLASLLVIFAQAVLIYFMLPIKFARKIAWPELRFLFSKGFIASLLPILTLAFQNMDRWVLAARVTPEQLGYVGFASSIGLASLMIPGSLAMITTTVVARTFGATASAKNATSSYKMSLWISSITLTFFTTAIVVSAPMILREYFAKYSPGTRVIAIIIVGYGMQFAFNLSSQTLLALDRRALLYKISVISVVLQLVIIYVLSILYGLDGAAVAILISSATIGLLMTFLAIKTSGYTSLESGAFALRLFAPFTIPVGCLFLFY